MHAALGVVAGALCFALGVLAGRCRQQVRADAADRPYCTRCGRLMSIAALEITDLGELARGTRSFVPGAPFCTTIGCAAGPQPRSERHGS